MEKLFDTLDGDEVYIAKHYSIERNLDLVTLLFHTHGVVGELSLTKSQADCLGDALKEKADYGN